MPSIYPGRPITPGKPPWTCSSCGEMIGEDELPLLVHDRPDSHPKAWRYCEDCSPGALLKLCGPLVAEETVH